MKQEWSRKWSGSSQPRKQRKYRHNAPLHTRHKFLSAHLSPYLRRHFGRRSFPLRKGDEVEVMVGKLKGKRGIVDKIKTMEGKVYVDNVKVKKVDGSEVMIALEPSNIKIIKLNVDDKKRRYAIERGKDKGKAEEFIKREQEKEKKVSAIKNGKEAPEEKTDADKTAKEEPPKSEKTDADKTAEEDKEKLSKTENLKKEEPKEEKVK
jgi:large subunit ribosomal protein L24